MNSMEEDQELKQHACKFCSKSFPCGRSLGGHMRSHITHLSPSAETEEKEKVGSTRKLLSSLNNGGSYTNMVGSEGGAGTNNGYGLRENPKKTWRISDSSEDTLVTLTDKLCKECGKGFHSWKALFGHMKCHSDKERGSINSLEDQDSWTNNASHNNQKLVMDSQSDNEATAPNRRRRSKRRRTRYMVAANPSSSSLSEVEQEQEEVAMSLMMLSRDLSPWSGLNSVPDFSDNNSAYFKPPSSVQTKIESKNHPIPNGSEIAKMIKQTERKWEFGNWVSGNLNSTGKSSDFLATENGFRMNKTGVSINGFIKSEKAKKSELDYVSALEDSEGEHGKNRVNGTESVLSKSATTANKYTSIKTQFFYSELKSNSLKDRVNKPSEAEFSKSTHKRGKFKCTTCNRIFHSYQALGGHRASHKKNKGCFASRNESSENSIETELSPDPTTESKLMKKNSDSEYLVGHEVGAGFDNEAPTVTESKKSKEHECPICLKVFPSGQALGGHKRSHLAGGSESRNYEKVVLEEPIQEIREFLDLNLPAAATEEESNSHADSNRPWWLVEGNHKQEALVGLMSS